MTPPISVHPGGSWARSPAAPAVMAPPRQILRPPAASKSFKHRRDLAPLAAPHPAQTLWHQGQLPAQQPSEKKPSSPHTPGCRLLQAPPSVLVSSFFSDLPPSSVPAFSSHCSSLPLRPCRVPPAVSHKQGALQPRSLTSAAPLPASPREAPRSPHHASHPHTHSPWSGGLTTLSQWAYPIPSRPRVAGEGLKRGQCR